jgi:hypothetical protein
MGVSVQLQAGSFTAGERAPTPHCIGRWEGLRTCEVTLLTELSWLAAASEKPVVRCSVKGPRDINKQDKKKVKTKTDSMEQRPT